MLKVRLHGALSLVLLGLIALVGLPLTIWSDSVFTNGLVAYYPFNGDAKDASGSGNHGTATAATLTVDRFEKANSAYAFDGVSSLITVPDAQSLRIANDITVTCWVKLSKTNLDVRFVGKGGDCGRSYGLWGIWGTGSFWMFQQYPPQGGCVGCQENTASVLPTVEVDRWFQMIGVRSGNISRLYVDGILTEDSDGQAENCSPNTYTGAEPLLIGAPGYIGRPGNQPGLMQGSLDDIRIYNRALSSSEVVQLHASESLPPPVVSRPATATATVVNGFVVGIVVTDGGSGYVEPPLVIISGNGPRNALSVNSVSISW